MHCLTACHCSAAYLQRFRCALLRQGESPSDGRRVRRHLASSTETNSAVHLPTWQIVLRSRQRHLPEDNRCGCQRNTLTNPCASSYRKWNYIRKKSNLVEFWRIKIIRIIWNRVFCEIKVEIQSLWSLCCVTWCNKRALPCISWLCSYLR